jgi:hypothetical protein
MNTTKMSWITKKIVFKEVRVWKGRTLFGRPIGVCNGYQLVEPLEYQWKEDEVMILKSDYAWDGPSYPWILEKIVGRRNKECLLAASAMHDSMTVNILCKTPAGPIYRKFSISEAAWLYKKMIDDWPATELSERKQRLQYIGLRIFQRFVTRNDGSVWKVFQQ